MSKPRSSRWESRGRIRLSCVSQVGSTALPTTTPVHPAATRPRCECPEHAAAFSDWCVELWQFISACVGVDCGLQPTDFFFGPLRYQRKLLRVDGIDLAAQGR